MRKHLAAAGLATLLLASAPVLGQANAVDFEGGWIWANGTGAGNRSTINFNGINRLRYCYDKSCSEPTYTVGVDGSISFSTNGKNYFEFTQSGNQMRGRFWHQFSGPARAPDAQIAMIRK